MSLSEISVRRTVTTCMITLIVIILGVISFLKIPVDIMPEITFPTVTVSTEYENVNPQEIETLITEPIEKAVSSVDGVERVHSVSVEGRSQVRVSFTWGTDLDAALSDLREKIDRIRDDLPRDAEATIISKFDVNASPVMTIGIAGDMDPVSLRTFVENQIQYRLERIPGVAAAEIRGGLEREIHVNLFLDKLKALDLSPADAVRALRSENVNLPAGHLDRGHLEVAVRTLGEFTHLDHIRDTVVARRAGTPVYIRDIARVEDSYKEIDNVSWINGRNAVAVSILRQPRANTVAVVERVKKEIESIHRDFSSIRVTTAFDNARYIRNAIQNVSQSAVWGGLLAVVILLFFLRNIRSTLVIATAIPVSVIATFALMYFEGFTVNIMSFGGLALGVGMLVDNSIVVLENIFRHREQGKDRWEAVLNGSREVAGAITASTLTTLVVFLPLIFIPGTAGILFKQLAWVVFFSIGVSLLVALTIVPVMAYHLLQARAEGRGGGFAASASLMVGRLLARLDGAYRDLLLWALGNKGTVFFGAVSLFALSMLGFTRIGREFMPKVDEGQVLIVAEMEEGTKIEKMEESFRALEAIVRKHVAEAQTLWTHFGRFGAGTRSKNQGHVHIWLVSKGARERSDEEIARVLRREVRSVPGVIARVRARGGILVFRRIGLGTEDNLEVIVRGHNLTLAQGIAEEVKERMMAIAGIAEPRLNQQRGQPEVGIRVDRDKAANLGISMETLAQTIETSLVGTRATLYREAGDEFNILVRLAERDRSSVEGLLDLSVSTGSGRTVAVKNLVQLVEGKGPTEINRLNQERIVSVSAEVTGRDMGSVVRELAASLREIRLPPDFSIVFGGDYEEQQEAFSELRWGLVLALVLVYMVMAAQFESLLDPLLIMFSVPLAAIGVVLMLFFTGTTFNMNSFIGVIVLGGVAVNNAIVLISYIDLKIREDGLSVREAIVLGGRARLRPILMTTGTTVLAMIPMALGLGEGGEVQAPLARVVIGGLTTSTLITLVLIPAAYATAHEFKGVKLFGWQRRFFWRLANGRVFRK